jgi:hypothetical protein
MRQSTSRLRVRQPARPDPLPDRAAGPRQVPAGSGAEIRPSAVWGNDYIAGGAGEDVIFGQLGNDVIQGDGTIGVKVYKADGRPMRHSSATWRRHS